MTLDEFAEHDEPSFAAYSRWLPHFLTARQALWKVDSRWTQIRPHREAGFSRRPCSPFTVGWLATLSDRIWLVRYAIRAALAEIKVWHVFPCPTRRPPCRGNPLTLATTFLRRRYCLCSIPPFGWNLIFVSSDWPINWTSYLSGHAGGERDLRVTLVAAHPYEAVVGVKSPIRIMWCLVRGFCTKCGREVGDWFNSPAWQCRDAERSTASSARSGLSGGGSRNQHAPNAESSWRRSHTCRASKTGIGS